MSDERLPDIKAFHRSRFSSRGLAVAAIVANYVALLMFLKAQGGQEAVKTANARLKKGEDALEKGGCGRPSPCQRFERNPSDVGIFQGGTAGRFWSGLHSRTTSAEGQQSQLV